MTSSDPSVGFKVAIRFVGERAVVAVRGEVDLVTASELRAALDEVIDRGHESISVDLSAVDFMGSEGIGVIADTAERLGASDRVLTVRSPSKIVCRLLDILGVAPLVNVEHPEPDVGMFDLGNVATTAEVASGTRDLTQLLRSVSALPSDDRVVDAALGLVVALARATVGGADGVSVSLRRRGRLSTVAASDQTISDMDASQYSTGEGPCVDASVEGRWFHAESLETEDRWPAFTPRAQALGISSILSSPLLASEKPVGALNIYSRTSAAFGSRDRELASLFAGEASRVLTDAGMGVTDERLMDRLQEALTVRQTIAQAQGVMMEREGVDEDTAYATLLRLSQETARPLRDLAQDVIVSTQRRRSDLGPRPWDEGHG